MAYGFAKQSGGALRIHSKVGFRTTISLYLPLACEQSEVKEKDQKSATQSLREKFRGGHNRYPAPRMQHQQVLIATDQRIGLGYQRQGQKLGILWIAAWG